MHFIKKRGFIHSQINRLATVGFVSTLGVALIGTIWAIYLESFLHNASYVGFLSTVFTITALISYFLITPLIEKNSKTKLYAFSIIAYLISYLLFSFLKNIYAIVALGIILSITSALKVTSFGIIVRDKSKDQSVSKNIGLIYTFLNISWLIGPLIAGFVAQKYGFGKVFLIASGIMFLSFLLFQKFKIKDERKEKKIDKNPLKLFIDFLKNKDRLRIYILSGGINFWWALIYIYIPIYIIESGLGDKIVGYFLFAVVIPLVLLEYYFGKLAAKKGFKKLFFTGYFLLGILALSCFFITKIYVILAVLALASVAISMLESTTESYFFDIIKKTQRDKFYGPYNTSIDISSAIATFIAAGILLFFPFKSIFIFFGLAMLAFAILSLRTKNIIEKSRH